MNEEIKNDMIKEEKEVDNRTCDEKLSDVLDEMECKHQTTLAKILYKKGLYHETEVKEFDLSNYADYTYKNGVKGYSVYLSNDGQLILVKGLETEAGEESYAYSIIYLAKVNEEDMPKIMEYKHPVPVFSYILFGIYTLFVIAGFVVLFELFFDQLESGFEAALQTSFVYCGSYLMIAMGIYINVFGKLFGKKCPCKGPRR